jgi:hypothetical protein
MYIHANLDKFMAYFKMEEVLCTVDMRYVLICEPRYLLYQYIWQYIMP